MCWAHMITCCRKHHGKLFPKAEWAQLESDINILQLAPNKTMFDIGARLFMYKWRDHPIERVNTFVGYFDRQWLHLLPTWYEGSAAHVPSTNNGLESLNNRVKEEHTLRQRLPLPRFLAAATEMVAEWSADSMQKRFHWTSLKRIRKPCASVILSWKKNV